MRCQSKRRNQVALIRNLSKYQEGVLTPFLKKDAIGNCVDRKFGEVRNLREKWPKCRCGLKNLRKICLWFVKNRGAVRGEVNGLGGMTLGD